MSLRFKKRIRVFPGIYLNIGLNGVSTTIGPRGANINIGKNGIYLNTGIPGTGFSSREKLFADEDQDYEPLTPPFVNSLQDATVRPDTFGNPIEILTSEGLLGLDEQISRAKEEREIFSREIADISGRILGLQKILREKQNGLFSKIFTSEDALSKVKDEIIEFHDELNDLTENYSACRADINFNMDLPIEVQYEKLITAFRELTFCQAIWDVTSRTDLQNTNNQKSTTKMVIERTHVQFSFENIDYINSKFEALRLQNSNGPDLYVFPGFILLKDQINGVLLIDLKDLKFSYRSQRFIESDQSIPSDACVVDHVWSKTNKDGSPDMRFKDNVQSPVVNYFVLCFETSTGLNETYYVSNLETGKQFSENFECYLKMLFPQNFPPESTNPLSADKLTIPTLISKEYFDLLFMLSNEVLEMKNILENDDTFTQSFSEILKTTKINVLMAFDLAKIFKILMCGNVDRKLVEMSVLFFGVCRLFEDSEIYRSMDYGKFIDLHSTGDLIKASESILNINVSMTVSEDGQDPAINKSDFVLPALLRHSENPHFDKYAVILCQFATVIAKVDGVVSGNEEKLLKEIYEKIHNSNIGSVKSPLNFVNTGKDQSLSDVLEELNLLVGLGSVKREVNTLINFAKIQAEREKLGLKSPQVSYHLVLTGAPGTGKTTVARIISKIYNKLGILETGKLVETDRSGLIAEYVGQTSAKVNRAVDSALDGVLFIDEAYSLIDGGKNDYGKEAIATLLKRMEDDREKLVVMVAGYTEEMKNFIDANSGLKSRFNKYIEFPDYTPEEMVEIFERLCKGLDYCIADEAKAKVLDLVKSAFEQRDRSFGNGRYVRNTFEITMERQANRVAGISPLTRELLTTIIADDIPEK